MKKTVKIVGSAFTAALLMLNSFAIAASADSEDYTVEASGDGVVITKYLGEEENIVIPSTFDGKSVVEIGSNAFQMNADIVSIEVPDGVTKISDHAFAIDSGLESITLPATVTEVGENAFQQCSSLTTVNFAGDESAWSAITFAEGNELITAITPSYNAALTEQEGSSSEDETSASEAASSEETVSSEAASREETVSSEAASSEETTSSEAASSEAASSEETTSSEAAASAAPAGGTAASAVTSSEEPVPQGSKANIPGVFFGILIGVAVIDLIYFSVKKPKA